MSDHVHLFLSAPPRYSPARLVNIIKSISRNEIFREFPGFARRCWSRKLWVDGYFVVKYEKICDRYHKNAENT